MATRSLNKAQLIGNLTRDPELRYTPQGTAVCTFGLATNRSWTTEGGEKREETEFHRIVSWNKLAELCSQLLFKGRRVFVEGRLQTRTWTGQDNSQRQVTEIIIEDMIILDNRRVPGEEATEVSVPEKTTVPETPVILKETVLPVTEENLVPEVPETKTEEADKDDSKSAKSGDEVKKKRSSKKEEKEETEVRAEDIPF